MILILQVVLILQIINKIMAVALVVMKQNSHPYFLHRQLLKFLPKGL
jgi:hypothetical protein